MQQKDKYPDKRHSILIVIALVLLFLCPLIYALSRRQSIQVVDCLPAPSNAPQSADGHFVDQQLIVMGPRDQLTAVTGQTTVTAILSPVVPGCDLGYLGQISHSPDRTLENTLYRRDELRTLQVNLYQIDASTTVTQAIEIVNAESARLGTRVYADPNYLTAGMVNAEACGNPNSTGGSPNSTGGSPNSTGGSGGGTSRLPASFDTYSKQWAFEHIGLGSVLHASYEAARVNYQGDGIRVGVFDTSPFGETAAQAQARGTNTWAPVVEPVNWVTPALTLTVFMPPLQSAVMASSPGVSLTHVLTDISDHGLFVSGLIHAVAPDSEVQLYPVLDQYGCGNLYTLITRLHTFISQAEVDRQDGRLNGAVINLSLGVLKPKNTDVIGKPAAPAPAELQQAQAPAESLPQQLNEAYALLKTDDIQSLAMTMQIAYQQGIVVVAAAGNDSWRDEYQSQPRPPQYPAAYPFVIGVAGSNAGRQRSCFSNWGDVSAPAGDGAPGEVTIVSGTITSTTPVTCAASLNLPLVSVVTNKTGQYPQGYAYWNGTSFATPLVSGLAALVLEAGRQQGMGLISPGNVGRAIKCGAATSDGVINVPVTILRCLRP